MSERKSGDLEFVIIASLILCSICIVASLWMLPKHCNLFDDNTMHPQMCHTIPMPENCHFCKEGQTALVASIIAGLGICFLLFPFVFLVIRNRRNNSVEQTKLFD